MIYITGDTHGSFIRISEFCARMGTVLNDVLITLDDAGIDISGGDFDQRKEEFVSKLPNTLLCIHGKHEKRPETIANRLSRDNQERIAKSYRRRQRIIVINCKASHAELVKSLRLCKNPRLTREGCQMDLRPVHMRYDQTQHYFSA